MLEEIVQFSQRKKKKLKTGPQDKMCTQAHTHTHIHIQT